MYSTYYFPINNEQKDFWNVAFITCSSFLERASGGERPAADAENVRVVVVDDFFSDDGVVNVDSEVVLLLLFTPFS